jgi:cysteinyl-tRNA synthetase
LREFDEMVSDDFNFPGGLGVLSGLFSELNALCDKPPVKDKALVGRTLVALRAVVRKMSGALGLFEDAAEPWLMRRRDRQVALKGIDRAKVEALLVERQAARTGKNFAESDRLRAELKTLGVDVMDSPAGQSWKVTTAL